MFSFWAKYKYSRNKNNKKNKNSLFNLKKNIGLVNQKSKILIRLKKRKNPNLNSQSLYYILNISWIKTIIFLSIFLTSVFLKIKSPIIIIVIIILQTSIICLMLWLTLETSWYAYILFLIFIGGLIVLFIYICSLASNEKFYIKNRVIENIIIVLLRIFAIYIYRNKEIVNNLNVKIIIIKIISIINIFIIILTIFFLLFTLIVAVKISEKKIGPVRLSKK